MASFDRNDIVRTFQLFHKPGDVVEVRVPRSRKGVVSGYVKDAESFADAAMWVYHNVEYSDGIYFTINQLNPDLLARSANTVQPYVRYSTSDENITRRKLLPIDLDPIRPSGISSTEEEHDAARVLARTIKKDLISKGWPEDSFVVADSGNGAYLNVGIDLPNDDAAKDLVQKILQGLDRKYSNDKVHVDTSTYNAARIMKIYGTIAKKGSNVSDRPHRTSKLLEYPDALETVSMDQLKSLVTEFETTPPKSESPIAQKLTPTSPKSYRPQKKIRRISEMFDPEKYAKDHGLAVTGTKIAKYGYLAMLGECPFDKTHGGNNETCLGRNSKGYPFFKCLHESCKDNHWRELKALLDPNEPQPALFFEDVAIDTGNDDHPDIVFSPELASKAVLENIPLAMTDHGKDIYYYDSGIWKDQGVEIAIDPALCEAAGDMIKVYPLKETVRRIESNLLARPVKFNPNPYLFPTSDGVVDLETGQSREIKPEDYVTFRYNAAYNHPNPDYRHFIWFLCSSLADPRDVLMMLDYLVSVGIRIPLDSVFLLFGSGNNGKLVYETVVRNLYTMDRGAFIDLKEMQESHFAAGNVDGKDYWIGTETTSIKDVTAMLKARATGDPRDHDVKYAVKPKREIAHEKPLFDANKDDAFDFKDNTHGRKRRFVVVIFPYQFGYTSDLRPQDVNLKEKLATPEVLSGLLQIIVGRAPALIKTKKIYRRKSIDEQEAELEHRQWSLSKFCDECLSKEILKTLPGKTDKVLINDVAYNEYKKYCQLYTVTEPSKKIPFGKYVCKKFNIESKPVNSKITYPGLYLVKTAQEAYETNKAEIGVSTNTATEGTKIENALKEWAGGNPVLISVTETITEMFEYIGNCSQPTDITYENYLKSAPV